MAPVTLEPPRAPPPRFGPQSTRWEKEKANGGSVLNDEPMLIGSWLVGETIGKGASGRVRLARHTRTGKIAAAKIIAMKDFHASRVSISAMTAKADKQRMGIEREILMMKLLDHPNILRIYDVWENDQDLYLILEYVDGGELFDYLVNRGKLPVPEALNYFRQIISGLHYCHSFSIIHRDLKPENILLCGPDSQNVKIADWGMATLQLPSNQLETSCGSPHYASPEIVNGQKYEGAPSDVWSSGVILFALLSGRLPFDDKNMRVLLDKVRVGKFTMPSSLEPRAKDLIARMLVVDSSRRITVPEILRHPFMNMEVPGIVSSLPPPLLFDQDALIRALSPDDICQSSFDSLMAIWSDKLDGDDLFSALTSPGSNFYKSIYYLLLRYKERSMEEYNMNEDYDGNARPHAKVPRHRVAPRPPAASPSHNDAATRPTRPLSVNRPKNDEHFVSIPSSPQLPRLRIHTLESEPVPARRRPASRGGTNDEDTRSPTSTPLGFDVSLIAKPVEVQETEKSTVEVHDTLSPIRNVHHNKAVIKRKDPGVPNDDKDKENTRTSAGASTNPPDFQTKKTLDMPGAYHTLRRTDISSSCPNKPIVNRSNARGTLSRNDGPKTKSTCEHISKSPRQGSEDIMFHSPNSQPSSLPAFTASPFLGTPVVSEFRGWFTNLFNWKAQALSLHSCENCLSTRDATARILYKLGVVCRLEDVEGWGILRCKLEEVLDDAGVTTLKPVRFRVEFTPVTGGGADKYVSVATLVLEKGALSSFKVAYQYLQKHWVLDHGLLSDNWVTIDSEVVA